MDQIWNKNATCTLTHAWILNQNWRDWISKCNNDWRKLPPIQGVSWKQVASRVLGSHFTALGKIFRMLLQNTGSDKKIEFLKNAMTDGMQCECTSHPSTSMDLGRTYIHANSDCSFVEHGIERRTCVPHAVMHKMCARRHIRYTLWNCLSGERSLVILVKFLIPKWITRPTYLRPCQESPRKRWMRPRSRQWRRRRTFCQR